MLLPFLLPISATLVHSFVSFFFCYLFALLRLILDLDCPIDVNRAWTTKKKKRRKKKVNAKPNHVILVWLVHSTIFRLENRIQISQYCCWFIITSSSYSYLNECEIYAISKYSIEVNRRFPPKKNFHNLFYFFVIYLQCFMRTKKRKKKSQMQMPLYESMTFVSNVSELFLIHIQMKVTKIEYNNNINDFSLLWHELCAQQNDLNEKNWTSLKKNSENKKTKYRTRYATNSNKTKFQISLQWNWMKTATTTTCIPNKISMVIRYLLYLGQTIYLYINFHIAFIVSFVFFVVLLILFYDFWLYFFFYGGVRFCWCAPCCSAVFFDRRGSN